MKKFFATLLVLSASAVLLNGCAHRDARIKGVRDITLADGSPAKLVECVSPGVCYMNAGKACPSGYEFLDSDMADRNNKPFTKEVRNSWIILCK
ncbi:MAG: hypothetical protein FWC38_01570 [Proteobacteria bacterium]|nr:hypothetical protein [Pseudomonadota bacterium]MCL2306930.1 hypothetical protein [Pseudomonadota bacterium]